MTQKDRVRVYLEAHPEGIDSPTAFNALGIYRLSSAIKRLRDDGMRIVTFQRETYALYRKVPDDVADATAWENTERAVAALGGEGQA